MKKIIFSLMLVMLIGLVSISFISAIEDINKCEINSDCKPMFSSCGCDYSCVNMDYEKEMDCARACSQNETGPIPNCGCVDNKCVPESNNSECTDSDGGKDYYIKGTAKGISDGVETSKTDHCGGINSELLEEYYCTGGSHLAYIHAYACPNGCKDGACVKKTICSAPNCVGAYPTGEYYEDGCPVYICPDIHNEFKEEEIKCVFKSSKTEQECYIAGNIDSSTDEGTKFCKGKETCIVKVKGYKGEKITWKSSCGGYAYTIIDGENEYAEFKCESGEVEEEEISNKGFMSAYWQCYDGEEEKQGTKGSCKSADDWRKQAKEFCKEHCYEDGSKCGINSFSLSNECYLENSNNSSGTEGEIIFNEETLICKNSCPLDNKCYPFGYRKSGEFCSDEGKFSKQLDSAGTCENNFECSSNVCVNNQCVSQGLIEKIMSWFKRLFGGE